MKPSAYSIILVFAVIMVVGLALLPSLEVGIEPTPQQGRTFTITCQWPGQPANVVEQGLTSVLEGVCNQLHDVENISSLSSFGHSEINIRIKRNANVSQARFELASILRQTYPQLPNGVDYPILSGGESIASLESKEQETLLLTWQVNSNLPGEEIKNALDNEVAKRIRLVEGVSKVEVAGVAERYVEVSYDPTKLAACGLQASDIASGLRNWLGRDDDVGTVSDSNLHVMAVRLAMPGPSKSINDIPIGNVAGNTVYLGELAQVCEFDVPPSSYYRVNGLETMYLNVYMPASGNAIATSNRVQKTMASIMEHMHNNHMAMCLNYDAAQQQRHQRDKLFSRTLMALAILLALVWIVSCDWRYTLIIACSLAASLLLSVISFMALGIKLHVY